MAATSNIKAGRAYVEVTADTSRLKSSLTNAQAQLKAFAQVANSIGRDLLMLSGTLALPFAAAIKSFSGFDDRMRLAQAVTAATDDEFKSLTKTAQRLGRETSFTAQQVADGMTSLGRMGFNTSEIEKSIGAVLNLSRATGTELATSADIAANAMRIYGLEAGKMSNVSDILAATANGSAQTLTDLFEGLKMVGPQAKAAGENITETCAALGVLANVGIKGSLAGTALRKSFSQFANVKVQDQLKAVGVETTTANGNLRKMSDIMADIARVIARMPSAEKLAFAEDIFDVRGSLAGLSLGGNIDELDAFMAKLRDVDGSAEQTAKKMDAGLGGSFRLLASAAEGAMNAVGEAVVGSLQPVVGSLTNALGALTRWIEANGGLVTAMAASIAAFAGLGASLITIGTVSKVASSSIALLSGTLNSLSSVQQIVAGEGTRIATSLTLISQAFAGYSNASMPVIVSTSRLLAALNLPLDSRAKQVAASLVLMSNAETAAAAKTMFAAKFQAATAVLKNFNAANIAATASTKLHTIALTVCAGATKALSSANALAATISGLFSGSNLKAAASATASSAANVLLAASTKLVASGYLLASSAAAAFCAMPITWVFIGISAAVVGLVAALSKASRYTAELSEKMSSMRERGDALRKTDKLRMERLLQLAEKQKLSNSEMNEAQKLAAALQGKYGDLGIGIDKVANKLTIAADAQQRFNDAMKKATLAQIDAEIAELRNNLSELERENESLTSGWVNAWNTITFRKGKSAEDIEANGKKAEVFMKKLSAAQVRRKAVNGDEAGSLTGEDENSQLQETIHNEKSRSSVTEQEAQNAAKKVSEIEKRLAREKRNELENEIADINDLRDEYKKLIQTMLEYEKSKSSANTERIAELERKLAEADANADQRIKIAKDKAQAEVDREVKELKDSFADAAHNIEQRRNEREADRELDKTLKNNPDMGISLLNDVIKEAQKAANIARAEFETILKTAQADGQITDEERNRIRKAQDAYSLAERLVDKYSEKLQSAQNGTSRAAMETTKPIGSFYAKAIETLRGRGDIQTRVATAAESIAQHTKKTNDLLKKTVTTSSLSFT